MPSRLHSCLLLALLAAAPQLRAAAPAAEAEVKAAFVYNFARYAEWPGEAFSSAQDPIRLCLYGGRDPFLAALANMDGKSAQNRAIRVQKVGRLADFRGCHILALAEIEQRQLPEALRAAQDIGSLSVGDMEGFADAGGTIGLVVDRERVQFEINLESARRANIKLSAQLLKLARRIWR